MANLVRYSVLTSRLLFRRGQKRQKLLELADISASLFLADLARKSVD